MTDERSMPSKLLISGFKGQTGGTK